MRRELWIAALLAVASAAHAQAPLPVLRARALHATAPVKLWNPAGSVRIVGWDRDSIVVRGRVTVGQRFFFGGSADGVKLGLEDRVDGGDSPPADLVVYVPRRARLSVRTASASITATDASGAFYSVSGAVQISGAASSVEAETMDGDMILDVATPWIRARTGDGRLLIRGNPESVDASTVAGALDVATPGLRRGRFASVTGNIRLLGAPAADGILDLSNHGGSVDLLLPRGAGGVFDLSTVTGEIENAFTRVRPVADNGGRSLHVELGRGGGHVTVRTFRGTIRLKPR